MLVAAHAIVDMSNPALAAFNRRVVASGVRLDASEEEWVAFKQASTPIKRSPGANNEDSAASCKPLETVSITLSPVKKPLEPADATLAAGNEDLVVPKAALNPVQVSLSPVGLPLNAPRETLNASSVTLHAFDGS